MPGSHFPRDRCASRASRAPLAQGGADVRRQVLGVNRDPGPGALQQQAPKSVPMAPQPITAMSRSPPRVPCRPRCCSSPRTATSRCRHGRSYAPRSSSRPSRHPDMDPAARNGRVQTVMRVMRSVLARMGASCRIGFGRRSFPKVPPQPSSAPSNNAAPAPWSTRRRPTDLCKMRVNRG